MGDWIPDLLMFAAGFTGGILYSMIASSLRAGKRQPADLLGTRTKILADVKQQHEQEILSAAVRTAEDIRGELQKSAVTLQKALLATEASSPSADPPDANPASRTRTAQVN
jgi:hypothetical protein